jgi:hypothetical protein
MYEQQYRFFNGLAYSVPLEKSASDRCLSA